MNVGIHIHRADTRLQRVSALKFCRNLKIAKSKDLINPEKKCIIKTVKIHDFRPNDAQAKAIARKPGR